MDFVLSIKIQIRRRIGWFDFGSEFAWNNAEYDSSQEHIEADAMCKSVDIDISKLW